MGGQKPLRFHYKYLINQSLEQHKDELLITEFLCLDELPLNARNKWSFRFYQEINFYCKIVKLETIQMPMHTFCTGPVHLHWALERKYIHYSILVPSVLTLAPYRAWFLLRKGNWGRLLWLGSSSNTHVWPVSAWTLIGGNSHCSPSALLRFTAISEI